MSIDQKNNGHIFKTTLLVTAMMFLFKILSFLKQALIANYFGATEMTDLYFLSYDFNAGMAQTIVTALSVSIIPVYTQALYSEGKKQAELLINSVFTFLVAVCAVILMGIFIFTPQIAAFLAPGYQGVQAQKLQQLLRSTSGVFAFIMVEKLCCSVLDAEQHFFVPRLQSLILSFCMIIAVVLFAEKISVYALVAGQYVSYVIFCTILLYATRKFVKLRFVTPGKELVQVFRLALPMLISNGAIEICILVEKSISTRLGVGAVSALSYSRVLLQLVTGLLIENVANIMFAHFSAATASGRDDVVKDSLTKTLNIMTYVLALVGTVIFVCSKDIVRIVYHSGSFTEENIQYIAILLKWFAAFLVFMGLRDILVNTMYSYRDAKEPMINWIITVGINIVATIVFTKFMGIVGIALGLALASVISLLLNMCSFKKSMESFSYLPLVTAFIKAVAASTVIFVELSILDKFHCCSFLKLIIMTIASSVLYIIMLSVLKVQEVVDLIQYLKTKTKKPGK